MARDRSRCVGLFNLATRAVPDLLVLHVGIGEIVPQQEGGICSVGREGKSIVVVVLVQQHRQTEVALVRHALGLLRALFCLREYGEQNRRKNGDDGNDDEEFDQSKRPGSLDPRRWGAEYHFLIDAVWEVVVLRVLRSHEFNVKQDVLGHELASFLRLSVSK